MKWLYSLESLELKRFISEAVIQLSGSFFATDDYIHALGSSRSRFDELYELIQFWRAKKLPLLFEHASFSIACNYANEMIVQLWENDMAPATGMPYEQALSLFDELKRVQPVTLEEVPYGLILDVSAWTERIHHPWELDHNKRVVWDDVAGAVATIDEDL